ncbi:MAG: biopolymer transporter ExbD [Gammaproteobacteria bacterium]|nr:biopolymer transporter ExbD [Gammaproteobacteria bacterium]MDH3466054.1 biopolymer transporter ExbD [Gammaproteobacteria bacterium]
MKRIDSINVIPLIDIMLVMLAIVLTTATFIKVGQIEIDLPSVSTAGEATNESGISITVDAEGRLFFNDEGTTATALDRELSALSRDTFVALKVDTGAEFGMFTTVVDILNRHGLENLSVLVQPANE